MTVCQEHMNMRQVGAFLQMLKYVFHTIVYILNLCSIRWIVEVLKNQELKCSVFINNSRILVKLFQKKSQNNNIISYEKFQK